MRMRSTAAEVPDGNPLRREPVARRLRRLEPAERHVEARAVEAGEPPREEPRDPVDAGPGHPELVADVEDPDRHQVVDGASPAPREVHTTAPESESRTMSPAPTRLKARALSLGSPTCLK